MSQYPTRHPERLATLSSSAAPVDHRTPRNTPAGGRATRFIPTSQNPPSSAGPNTASRSPNILKALAKWAFRTPGISPPMMQTGPGGIALGFLTYATLKLLTAQRDKVSVSLYVLCIIFIAKFAFL